MKDYIARMKKLGFKTLDAVHIYEAFKRYFDLKHLNDFVTELEEEQYVANV